jgi:hypothetical protein
MLSLKQIREEHAERALKLLLQGPIHMDTLARHLYTSSIEAAHAIYILKKRGYYVNLHEDMVSLDSELINLYLDGVL